MTMRWKYFSLARGLRSPDEDSGAVEPGNDTAQLGGPLGQSEEGSDAPETSETPAPESPEPQGGEPPKKAWYYDRIDKLTRRLRETEEAAAAERARREALERGTPPSSADGAADSSSAASGPLAETEIRKAAAQLRDAERFNERANEVWMEGQRSLPGFTDSVTALQQMAGGQLPMAFVSTVLELDMPAKVLNELAKKPDLAYELMFEGNITRQASRLAKFEATLTAPAPPPKVSSAPPPVAPKTVSNTQRTDPTVYDEDLSIGQWMKLRNKR